MSLYSTVIFDLDGLMADTEPIHRRTFNIVLDACGAGYAYSPEEYGQSLTGFIMLENAERARERFGLVQTAQEISRAHHALYNVFIADVENIRAMPGLTELLAYLTTHNIRTAIASSAHPEQIARTQRGLNLPHKFDAISGNDGTMKPKPAPDVYLHALEKLGANPAETIALEDTLSGVRAAQAAGLYTIAVPNEYSRFQDFSVANSVQPDLYHVRKFFDQSKIIHPKS